MRVYGNHVSADRKGRRTKTCTTIGLPLSQSSSRGLQTPSSTENTGYLQQNDEQRARPFDLIGDAAIGEHFSWIDEAEFFHLFWGYNLNQDLQNSGTGMGASFKDGKGTSGNLDQGMGFDFPVKSLRPGDAPRVSDGFGVDPGFSGDGPVSNNVDDMFYTMGQSAAGNVLNSKSQPAQQDDSFKRGGTICGATHRMTFPQHALSIGVVSSVGKGATFLFELPMR